MNPSSTAHQATENQNEKRIVGVCDSTVHHSSEENVKALEEAMLSVHPCSIQCHSYQWGLEDAVENCYRTAVHLEFAGEHCADELSSFAHRESDAVQTPHLAGLGEVVARAL